MLDTLARGKSEEFGFRCHAEHITVPLVMGPNIPNPSAGLHDTMSVSASILDMVSIDPHPAFLGNPYLHRDAKPCDGKCRSGQCGFA